MGLSYKIFVSLLLLSANYAWGDVSNRYQFLVPGVGQVSAKVYSYSPHSDKKHHVIFKYSDIVTRARKFKENNQGAKVVVRIALYKIAKDVWVGIDPSRNTYGKVSGADFDSTHEGGGDTEKFLWSIKRAKSAGVDIRLLYHNPKDDDGVIDFLDKYLEYGKDFRKVSWGKDSIRQMHNKFVIASHTQGDSEDSHLENVVYTATSNIDAFGSDFKPIKSKRLAQVGTMVSNHNKLFQSYKNYFDVMWNNHGDHSQFKRAVRARHKSDDHSQRLNYRDSIFRAYFFPVIYENNDYYAKTWFVDYNPFVELAYKITAQSIEGFSSYVKINSYIIGTSSGRDPFVDEFNATLVEAKKIQPSKVHVMSAAGLQYSSYIEPFNGQKLSGEAKTHAKTYLFAFPSLREYYSLVGSANFKAHAFQHKANNLIMINEPDKSGLYQVYKNIFYNVYSQKSIPLKPN